MIDRTPFDRRRLIAAALGLGAGMLWPRAASAAPLPETVALWPGAPPGGPAPTVTEATSPRGSLTGITQPRLNLHHPDQRNGTAILVMAGGGYAHLESGHESAPASRWLAGLGILAAELIYRLPADGWPPDAPFQDAQRALRLLRGRAAALGITRLGVLGFSAGGHLAAMSAVRPDAALYRAVDAADAGSARPDFAGLLYPVIDMLPPLDRTRSCRELLGRHPDPAAAAALSADRQVTAAAPPMFLAQSTDDPIAPIENSRLMASALGQAGVPAELHVFDTGGHGWGMGRPGTEPAAWPDLFRAWLDRGAGASRHPAPI